jgi:hypothetical protein
MEHTCLNNESPREKWLNSPHGASSRYVSLLTGNRMAPATPAPDRYMLQAFPLRELTRAAP